MNNLLACFLPPSNRNVPSISSRMRNLSKSGRVVGTSKKLTRRRKQVGDHKFVAEETLTLAGANYSNEVAREPLGLLRGIKWLVVSFPPYEPRRYSSIIFRVSHYVTLFSSSTPAPPPTRMIHVWNQMRIKWRWLIERRNRFSSNRQLYDSRVWNIACRHPVSNHPVVVSKGLLLLAPRRKMRRVQLCCTHALFKSPRPVLPFRRLLDKL